MRIRYFCYSLGVAVFLIWVAAPALANPGSDSGQAAPSSQHQTSPENSGSAAKHSDTASQPLVLSERMHLDASPDTVWTTVRDFSSPELWMPGIEDTDLIDGQDNQPGARRQMTLQDDSTVVEQLVAWDGPHKRLTYRMLHGSLPVSHYQSTLAVQSDGKSGSYIVWEARFEPGDKQTAASARQAMQQYYVKALKNLATMLSADSASDGNSAQ